MPFLPQSSTLLLFMNAACYRTVFHIAILFMKASCHLSALGVGCLVKKV